MHRQTRQNPPATLRDTAYRAPRLVLVMDGPYVSVAEAMIEAENRGQRLTLAIAPSAIGTNGFLGTSAIQRAARAGHGITSMGWTYNDATALSASALAAEYDEGLKWISTTTGKPMNEIDLVYRQSAHNDTTSSLWYLRGRRAFAGPFGPSWWNWRFPFYQNRRFLSGRYGWDSDNHRLTLRQIEEAAAAGEDIVVYVHSVDGSNLNTMGVTRDEFRQCLDLALRLRMPVVTTDELGDAPDSYLDDPGFEDPDNFATNFSVTASGLTAEQYTAEIVDVTPATGLPGTKALRIAVEAGAPSNGTVVVEQRRRIPTTDWAIPPFLADINDRNEAVFGARVKCNKSSGDGGARITLRTANWLGTTLSGGGQVVSSPTRTTNTWSDVKEMLTTGFSETYDRDIGMITYGQQLIVQYGITNMVGEAWFDHAMLSVGINDNFA